MSDDNGIFIGKGDKPVYLLPQLANRHGLIAGATGTGKTVSLQILAEGFSRMGVPVFMADVKGDLSGISQPGEEHPKLAQRAETIGLDDYAFERFPVVFWDLFGEQGHRVRTTVSELGPLLLSRMLDLNDTQEGIMYAVFKMADDQGLLLLDLKDLRALLVFAGENAKELRLEYGNISAASIGAIQRRLLVLEEEGAGQFLGEPALDIFDFMRTGNKGYGNINILAADKLMQTPRLYAVFLLWLLAELFEELPEVGDPDKPRLVFFFDEAHLLFTGAPKALLEKVEQVVRLIRSKGVGIYFVTQNPLDIPDTVLSQLGNRVQHALRAFTPRDQKAVRAAASTFRANPAFSAVDAIGELGVGEALVSTLGGKGTPGIVERTLVRPPASRLGPATRAERNAVIEESTLGRRYDKSVDAHSAYEMLKERAEKAADAEEKAAAEHGREKATAAPRRSNRQGIMETMVKSVVRSVGSSLGRKIARGILGSLLK
ncbi:MAG TPA: helicase HerA-like domain-containing protein [Gammaproteobacteria bacterium]|jgi:DNA helicase HerA-like ATPase|nr:helicase HerA-like domain-containing protein [Gammaproteobacteria bacterium]